MKSLGRFGSSALAGAAAAVAAVMAFGGSACTSSSGTSSGPGQSEAVCPATAGETLGAVCSAPGLVCAPQYTCGLITAAFLCTCTDGHFLCADSAGRPLTAVPACPATPEAGSCPPTEARASFASCSETGLLCAYASACPASFDQCECFPGKTADGGFGLRFECSPALCTLGDSGAPIDGGSDSMFDAGESGAGSDSAAEADARPSGDAAAEADSARGADSASDAGAETTADALSEVASASDADSTETASGSDVDSASEAGSDGDSASSEGAAGDAGRG